MKPYKNSLFALLAIVCMTSDASAQSGRTVQSRLRHVVVVTFKPGTPAEQIQAVDNSFKKLATLKMAKGFEWGIVSDDGDTAHIKHVYVTTFLNKHDEAAYGASPQHQAHIKLGADYIESVSATDYFVQK